MTVTKSTKSTSVATTADAVAAAKARLAKVVADPTRPEGKPAARAARKPAAKPVVERDAEAARELAIGEADARAAYEAEQAKSVNDDVQPAKLVDVVVVGPNLQTRTGETFHVHSPKCADRKRPVYARTDHQNSWDSIESHSSIQDLIESVEADIMRENDQVFGPGATDWKEYESEFKIYACVKGLPTAEPLTPGQLAELEAAKPARKPRTARAAVAVETLTGADELYWPCDTCKAEQGARCTQKSGRVKTYFHSDRAKSVELFAKYGIADHAALVKAFADDVTAAKPAAVVEPAKPAAAKPAAKPAARKPGAAKLVAVK